MAVDLAIIEKRGGTQENLKSKFSADSIVPDSKISGLLDLTQQRINDGIRRNLSDARLFWAIDQALDAPIRQTTYTLVEGLLSRKLSSEQVLNAVKGWGFSNMLSPVYENGTRRCDAVGNPMMQLDLQTFFQIFLPTVLAYCKIRRAKLINDRDEFPLYKYDPIKLTMKNRVRCDIVTDRIERMTTEMGYRNTEIQSVTKMLDYGICLNFPMEEWYSEKQVISGERDKEKTRIIREGIRYALPHPTRTCYDLAYPVSSFNTDTGSSWAFYWDIARYGDIQRNPKYWNKELIDMTYGGFAWLRSDLWSIYRELFPCQFIFPDIAGGDCGGGSQGAGQKDRLNRAQCQYYGKEHGDNAVTIVPIFQKLVPSEWDLYDYDYPVWHRFVMAGDRTIIYAAPVAYSPVIAYLYDWDDSRAFNTSLALEVLPFQDHLSNLFTQYILSVKQSLANVCFWNRDMLEQKDIDQITNFGEKLYRTLNFIGFSREELSWQGQRPNDAFYNVAFPKPDTAAIASAVTLTLSMMERMLGFSPQELGAAATHEQTAEENRIIAINTGVRLRFTGSFIDIARSARMTQLYDGMMAYSNDEIFAEIAEMNDVKRAALKEMGFTVEEEETGSETKAGIKGSKKALVIDGFAALRGAGNHVPDAKIAVAMLQAFQTLFAAPPIIEAVGLPQLIEMFNQIAFYAGLPRDYRIKIPDAAKPKPEQAQAAQGELEAMAAALQQNITGELAQMGTAIRDKLIVPLEQKQQQLGAAIAELINRQGLAERRDADHEAAIQKIAQVFAAATQPPPIAPPMPPAVPVPQSY